MFTGIITDIGQVAAVTKASIRKKRSGAGSTRQNDADVRLTLATRYDTRGISIGASVAVSGACLTVVAKTKNTLSFDVSAETLACTTLGALKKGSRVNLERSLKIGDELGGHLVGGHVDGVIKVIEKKDTLSCRQMPGSGKKDRTPQQVRGDNTSCILGFSAPKKLMRFIAEKGSVTLNGVSLTVNRVSGNRFWVNIIPHTLQATTLGALAKGDPVNLEIDMLARYVERLKGDW